MGQADIVNRAEDLPERTRAADTAAQLGALRETLRMDATESASEAAGGFRASEFEGAVSRHPATGRGGPPEIEPPSAVCGEKAPIARPHPGVAWGHGPEMKLGLLGGADRPPQPAAQKFDFLATNRRLRDLRIHYHRHSRANIAYNFKLANFRVSRRIMHLFEKFGGNTDELAHRPSGFTLAEQAYCTLQKTARQVQRDGDRLWAGTIHEALDAIDKYAVETLQAVCPEHGMAEAPSTQAMQQPPATAGSSVTVVPMTVAPPVRLDIPVLEIRIVLAVDLAFPESAGGLVRTTDVPDPPPASGLPVPSLSDAGDLGRARLDQPATAAEQPTTTEASVTPSLGETSSFWLKPVDPAPARGTVPFDSGLHHAGETVQPPPVTTAPGRTAPALSPGAPFLTPSWVDDDFAVERALLAGDLPPRFNAARLIAESGTFEQYGLAGELAAGRLPIQAIDGLIEGYRATDEGGSNTRDIEHLHSLKESIERALHDAYPGRVDPPWLDLVRALLRPRGDSAPPSAASATGLPEIDPLLGTGEGVSHAAGAHRGGRRGASPRRRPVAHSTAGDGRRAAPRRLRRPVRTPRSRQPGRVHRDDTHSGAVDRRTAGVAGRRDARLRPGGRGRRRAPVLAPRGDCPPVQYRRRVVRRRAHGSAYAAPMRTAGPRRRSRLCSTTSTGSTTPSSSRTPRPPRRWSTSTGARLRRWCPFSISPLFHRDPGRPCRFADHSSEAHT